MKYILVTGGTISGFGKDVIAVSMGTILKHSGLRVTSIKIDPCLNMDAGNFSPYEHGEVYVLEDGGIVDMDLGIYERFLDVTLHTDNHLTTGKVYSSVIEKERRGDYLGKTVQVVPHITDAILQWVERVAHKPVDGSNLSPEVCIIELGGTIGDIERMPFVEAFSQFQFRLKGESFVSVHVSMVPQPNSTGEHKTKPTEDGIRELRRLGLSPDIIACRSDKPIGEELREEISHLYLVDPTKVICLHDSSNIYAVPLMLEDKICSLLNSKLNLSLSQGIMTKWRSLLSKQDDLIEDVKIALVGKYTKLNDAYASVIDALNHAALTCNRKLTLMRVEAEDLEDSAQIERPLDYEQAWQSVHASNGVLVPGGNSEKGLEGKIFACKWARESKVPFLGVCLGMEASVIEFSRNVLGMKEQECIDKVETKHGVRRTILKSDNSIIKRLFSGADFVNQRHCSSFQVSSAHIEALEKAGMKFVAEDEQLKTKDVLELDDHPYYVACHFRPEYQTRLLKPSPPYLGLILAAVGELQSNIRCNGVS